MKEIINKIIDKSKMVIYYLSLGLIFIIIGLMIAMPFIVNKTYFKGDDIISFNKTINVIAIDGKLAIKSDKDYFKTPITYEKYYAYIDNYKKSSNFKTTLVIELFLLFLLLEFIFIYFIVRNIISLFIDKEDNEYRLYIIKKSFTINVISIYVISLIRRIVFRNTVFSSLSASLLIYYICSIYLFYIVYKIIEMNKVTIPKVKKYGKTKEDN